MDGNVLFVVCVIFSVVLLFIIIRHFYYRIFPCGFSYWCLWWMLHSSSLNNPKFILLCLKRFLRRTTGQRGVSLCEKEKSKRDKGCKYDEGCDEKFV